LEKLIADLRPDAILNAAAFTAVDKAESERELASNVNATAPGVIAAAAKKLGAALVHYSTDYVFDGSGTEPHKEDEPPNPLNHYGTSKLLGERLIAQNSTKHLIFRTSWVYAPRGNNFPKTILRLAQERDTLSIVDDQIGAPTSAALIAEASLVALRVTIASDTNWGLYHLTASGSVSWFGFAQKIIAEAEMRGLLARQPKLLSISSSNYQQAAKRPLNSKLDTSKFRKTFAFDLPSWEEGIGPFLDALQNHRDQVKTR
jgi:dTDP-4-dehydrorhamnose reductase